VKGRNVWQKCQSGISTLGDGCWRLLTDFLRIGFTMLFLSQLFRHTNAWLGFTRMEVLIVYLHFEWVLFILRLILPDQGINGRWTEHGVRGVIRSKGGAYGEVTMVFLIGILLAISIVLLPGRVSWLNILFYVLFQICGGILLYSVFFILNLLSEKLPLIKKLISPVFSVLSFFRFPFDIYPFFFKSLFIYVFPAAFVFYLPVRALFGDYSFMWLMSALGLALFSWGAARAIGKGIR